MTHPVVSVGIEATVADGAAAMLSRRIHRVFGVDGGRAVGVFSTRDAMAAVRAIGIATPIATLMSRQPVAIPCTAPLSLKEPQVDLFRVIEQWVVAQAHSINRRHVMASSSGIEQRCNSTVNDSAMHSNVVSLNQKT